MNEMENEKPFDRITSQWAFVALLCSLPIYFLFAQLGNSGRGRAAAICFGMSLTAIRARWDLRNAAWFWIVATSITILHIPLLLWFSWSDKSYPGFTLLPIALADFGIYYGLIVLGERIFNGKR